jgi:RNA polymerase sigma factor (sigma-70 family)
MRDDPSVVDLVTRAADGDRSAWDEIVERYAPLVWSICARYRLSSHDAEDVGQAVWLLLVEQLRRLREPAALPGWLSTTTQRECLRTLKGALKHERAYTTLDDDPQQYPDVTLAGAEEEIIAAERRVALRQAFDELSPDCQRLLSLLISDPPCSYAQISATLQIKIGSIGPSRARCLQRMRRSRALAAFRDVTTETRDNDKGGEASA